jgi:hypothetical protein
MVAVVVLLILIGVMAVVAQSAYRSQKLSQAETQAYYTAHSVNERITDWLSGTSDGDGVTDQQRFIAGLKQKPHAPIAQSYDAADLDPSGEGKMGSAEVEISISDDEKVITIRVTGHFAGDSETIVSTLGVRKGTDKGSSPPLAAGFDDGGKAPPSVASFSAITLANYADREDELNEMHRDASPAVVGNESSTGDNQNQEDQLVANLITGDKRELTYARHSKSLNTTLGTNHYTGFVETANSSFDNRRFVTPPNGRWTINPLQEGGDAVSTAHKNSATAESNSRPIMLSVGDYKGKDLLMRLGGQSITSTTPNLKNDATYYNSLISFDVTDYDDTYAGTGKSNPFVEYYDNNVFSGARELWYPQGWDSMTVFTQDPGGAADAATVNAGVDARLVFGPFLHTYNQYGDFWNWGRYVGNPKYGQNPGDYWRAFPGHNYSSSSVDKRVGMAHIPEYYGEDFSLYLNDRTDKAALIIQGVNILGGDDPSVVYSKRPLEIGGGLVKSVATYDIPSKGDALGQTTRHVNSNISGYSYGYAPVWTNYFPTTTRYSQIIYNTNIVLRTPDGVNTPRFSRIFDAALPDDGAYGKAEHDGPLQGAAAKKTILGITGSTTTNNFSDDYNKQFSPTVRVVGGGIYVGAGQTLAVDGGRVNPKNTNAGTVSFEERTVTLGTDAGEYTQVVAPDSITVAGGGTLTVRGRTDVDGNYVAPSDYANVASDIFVRGVMNMTQGAKVKGNILVDEGGEAFAYGDEYEGAVNVASGGAFTMGRNTHIVGDIFVRGNAVVAAGGARTKGTIIVKGGGGVTSAPGTANPLVHEGDVHIASGGVFTVDANMHITGDLYVQKGGTLTIDQNAVITGDVHCVGKLTVEGTFTLNRNGPADGKIHGIIIYHDPDVGSGTLEITNPSTTTITGDSGKIHSLVGYMGITDENVAQRIFCDDCNEDNVCEHWKDKTTPGTWEKQGDIVRE